MLNIITRYCLGLMLIIGSLSMLITHESGMSFPIVLFPIGMAISGLGTFLHGPMDPVPASFYEIPGMKRFGIVLLLIGMICMLLSAIFKAIF